MRGGRARMNKNYCWVAQIDVFTKTPGKGNSAGVVLEADKLTSQEMQAIAFKAGFSETVFVQKSQVADLTLRYFMPEKETPLCGHGTIGAIWYYLESRPVDQLLTIETKAGILEVAYESASGTVSMRQQEAKFIPYDGESERLCQQLGIEVADLWPGKPIVYGYTGVWTLLVPVKEPKILAQMVADNQQFPKLLPAYPEASIHPFAPSHKSDLRYEARHFSGVKAGVLEDAVTGTASGVIGAYDLHYCSTRSFKERFTIGQGHALDRFGKVEVSAWYQGVAIQVAIKGTACEARQFSLSF